MTRERDAQELSSDRSARCRVPGRAGALRGVFRRHFTSERLPRDARMLCSGRCESPFHYEAGKTSTRLDLTQSTEGR